MDRKRVTKGGVKDKRTTGSDVLHKRSRASKTGERRKHGAHPERQPDIQRLSRKEGRIGLE